MFAKASTVAGLMLATLLASASQGAEAVAIDLKRATPVDAYLVVYARNNPERDYQRAYLAAAWETACDEHLGERLMKIVSSRASKNDLSKAKEALNEIKNAIKPINLEAFADIQEIVIAQRLNGPIQPSVVAVRMTDEDAEGLEKGLVQLFELLEDKSKGDLAVIVTEADEEINAAITQLKLPRDVPFQPCVARLDDVVFFSTSADLLKTSIAQYLDESAESKFDDPRLVEALEHLPEAEDSITFFDGRQLFKSLDEIGDFIRSKSGGDEDAQRAASLIDRIVDEIAVFDYEACVEYTEDGQNRVAALGKLMPNAKSKLLGRAISQGKPFTDWHSWVPAEATAYSLSTGLNLHVLYEGVMEIVRDEFPETHEALDQFEEQQDEIGVHIDRDVLQSFSGETVSVTLPVEAAGGKSQQSVTALKCNNPDRIEELLERAVNGLGKLPALKAQQIELVDCDDEALEGFKQINATFFQMAGVKPVIGFHDGWMIISSHADAAAKLVAVRNGDAESIDRTESLEKFDLDDAEGDVYAVSYRDIGEGIRQFAAAIDQAGMMAPMMLGMAAAQADPEDIKPVQEALGLLPSIAKVIRKFDFYEQQLSVTSEGPLPNSYVRNSVTLIRQQEGK
jgi:hypothetical protein